MRIVIVGGHIGPALAVIENLPKDTDIFFIGRRHTFEGDTADSFEYQQVRKLGIPFHSLRAGRLQRRISRHVFSPLLQSPSGVFGAYRLLSQFKPDVVLSFGGYLSVPVAFAARLLSIPVVIHEQTLHAGLANKIIAKFAVKICISWEKSSPFFPKTKTVLTGIPLRSAILKKEKNNKPDTPSLPLLYVTGGSSGSHAINELVCQNLPGLLSVARIVHQTGNAYAGKDYEQLLEVKASLPQLLKDRYEVVHFLSDSETASVLRKADLVISRSGINTVSELLYLEKPSLCIPLPYGQIGEQEENALFLVSTGLSEILRQQDATPKVFIDTVVTMLAKRHTYQLRIDRSRLNFEGAAARINSVLSDVVNKASNKKT